MAKVFKQTYSRPMPPDATPTKVKHGKKEVPGVRFKGTDGRMTTARLTKDGTRILLESATWYGRVKGSPVPLCTNKAAAETMLQEKIVEAERQAVGLPTKADVDTRTMDEHLADYRRHLESQDNTTEHVDQCMARVGKIVAGCGFTRLADLDAGRVAEWLASQRGRQRKGPALDQDAYKVAEAAKLLSISPAGVRAAIRRFSLTPTSQGKATEIPRDIMAKLLTRGAGKGMSAQTSNHYHAAIRAFGIWLTVDGKRMQSDPFATLKRVNVKVDRRHDRRELSAEEVHLLLKAARSSKKRFRGLSGVDRCHIYAAATGTGLRARALAGLTPADFKLDGSPPLVVLPARLNKSRKPKRQPIQEELVETLRAYLAGKPNDQPIWPGTWASDKKAAAMLRIDLAAAGIPYEVPGPDGPLFADFHALRHTFLTLGGRSGISLHVLQDLAGHASPNTTKRYVHVNLNDLAEAVKRLPGNRLAPRQEEASRLSSACRFLVVEPDSKRPEAMATDGTRSGEGVCPHCRKPLPGMGLMPSDWLLMVS